MPRVVLVAVVALCAAFAGSDPAPPPPIVLEAFERPGCPHCARAEAFLHELAERHPDVQIVRYDVTASPAALARLRALAEEAGVERLGVPAIYLRGRLFIGFDSADTTGRQIEALLVGDPRADPDAPIARVPWFGELDARRLGLPLFTIVIALVDGFNPCAMWVLLFLLSMLVHVRSRARVALIAGVFVTVSALVYFAFMAAWLEFFLLVGMSRWLQLALGVLAVVVGAIHVKDFVAFGTGPSLSIPQRAKPGIYARVRRVIHAEHLIGALVGVTGLAIAVNLVELVCTAGLPALYTHVLASYGLPGWQHYGYLAIYAMAYMVDDALMVVIAVATLRQHKLQVRGGRWLKLVSGVVMLILGLLLVLRPEWLLWG